MRTYKTILFLLTTIFITQQTIAQKPGKQSQPVIQKNKLPKLQTLLDSYKDSVKISVAEAQRIIALPLKIYDEKKNEYSISSYQFLFRRKEVTEDEQSGKVSPTSSITSDRFKATPLPELWRNIITQDIRPGEELYFFDVIAKDAQGRVMYAPSLKIITR